MPRFRPRIRRSPARIDAWKTGAAIVPTTSFDLTYAGDGYRWTWDEQNKKSVALEDLLETNADAPQSLQGWTGLMLPDELNCRVHSGVVGNPQPSDFYFVEEHEHHHWRRINDEGDPAGESDKQHTHELGFEHLMLCTRIDDQGQDLEDRFYPEHLHPVPE